MSSPFDRPLPAPRHRPHRPHRVAVLALDGVVAFELGLPHRFFSATALDPGWPGRLTGAPAPYEVTMSTLDDGPVTTSAGYAALPTHPNSTLSQADTIVVPGITKTEIVTHGRLPQELVDLAATARPEARWLSICTGAFVLAGLGKLDGREATTHWVYADLFRRHFPLVDLDPDVLYVDHGDVLTSAGNAAGIDLLLHVLRSDLGSDAANRVARGAVVAPWRAGGQAQFIERPVPDASEAGTGPTRTWVLEHLGEPISLSDMARHAGMSVRTFTRRFREETGETAGNWLVRARVERARQLLETTELPVDRVAADAGFGTTASLRQHLGAAVGLSPLAYRRTYRAEPA
ncbi:transcriptional regulator GlxA family with amidase domain [Humibacillus xanthopallidus]|uniref:Transcriptional regulator GlxA family with amidase domain n=1 Tax=Humibacillus xanthopallidus TaxID=412689 RepID=A0A543PSZ5_9MICO|nr:helix-turn-helix domain-containing protein [Humibacillus xanthopallidus]TQN47197.1 transcriptional regulator GlxA family with amidase domain [Humibacillus xanthopallidus]